jgi:ubiquinone/menaquinone biosynthesis C-methylase UbiE
MSDVERFVRFCDSEFGAEVMDREAAYLERFLESGDRILDVGAGIGSIEERLPDHDIIGLDVSEVMVKTARTRVEGQLVAGDARALPISTDTVEVVLFVATLEFIAGIESALSEAGRVLRPGGHITALLLNTRSAYVRSNLQRADSYFQQMVHRDTEALAKTIADYVDTKHEYFLGIRDRTIFETADPEEAAVLAVSGEPYR